MGDFGEDDPEQVLQAVVAEIRHVSGGDFSENQFLQQLRIFVHLLNSAIEFDKVMETVAKFFKEEDDPLFIRGARKGRIEGIEDGKAEVVRNLLLTRRFTISEIAALVNVKEAFVGKIAALMKKG